jgi:hypothetical protein
MAKGLLAYLTYLAGVATLSVPYLYIVRRWQREDAANARDSH